jgi:phosphoribosylaminoimidazole-succinocarboxamide synthase
LELQIPLISYTNFPGLSLRGRGKVRDIYDLGDKLLIVATDRLSAFDVVLPTPIPDKGCVLTQLSLYWFEKLGHLVLNHVIAASAFDGDMAPHESSLRGRAMLVQKTEPIPIECVVRGFIAGSGLLDYQKTGSICGVSLPVGLRDSDKLPDPIFTPSTKVTTGHDENISFDEMVARVGKPLAERLRDTSLALYRRAYELAAERGIIIADTKFEFGLLGD